MQSFLRTVGAVVLVCAAAALSGCQSGSSGSSGGTGTTYQAGHDLGNFVGTWNIAGWSLGPNNEHVALSGAARAVREKNYFVRMDVNFPDPASGSAVDGTVMFSQSGGRAIRLTTWFSSSPVMRQFEGTLSADGKSAHFKDGGSTDNRELKLRILGPNAWDAEVWRGGVQIELYSFTRSGI